MVNAVRNIEASIVILILGSLVSLLLARNRKVCGWVSFAFVCASSRVHRARGGRSLHGRPPANIRSCRCPNWAPVSPCGLTP